MKKYDSDSIYFGNTIYNAGPDGYYYSSNYVYEKISENRYKLIGKNYSYEEYKIKTSSTVTCSDLFPLSALLDGESKMLTVPMIELYKLKYMALKIAGKLPVEDVVAPFKDSINLEELSDKIK